MNGARGTSGTRGDAPAPAGGSSAATHVEDEVAYVAEAGWRMPLDGGGFVSRHVADVDQEAIYVDTPGLALLDRRVTLRRRTGGLDDGWHLKLPGDADVAGAAAPAGSRRLEVHAPVDAGRLDVPAGRVELPPELAERVRDIVDPAVLVPVARIVTRRTVHEVARAGEDAAVAEVCDDTVSGWNLIASTGAAHDGEPERWREVEVEAADTDTARAAFPGVLRWLESTGLSVSPQQSKLARVLRRG